MKERVFDFESCPSVLNECLKFVESDDEIRVIRIIGDIVCWESGMMGLWMVQDVECSGCGMLGTWDVGDVWCCYYYTVVSDIIYDQCQNQ